MLLERNQTIENPVLPRNDPVVFDDRAVLDRAAAREQSRLRSRRPPQVHRGLIVRVDDRDVVGVLVLEHSALRSGVRLERVVAIQMVRREVQHHGNPRSKSFDLLQLKTAHLDHMQRLGRGGVHLCADWLADVAAHRYRESRLLQHSTRQRRRRRFSLRACNRDHAASQPSEREFHFADHRNARRSRSGYRGQFGWNARAQHNQFARH